MKLSEALQAYAYLCAFILDTTTTIEDRKGDKSFDVASFINESINKYPELVEKTIGICEYAIDANDTVLAKMIIRLYNKEKKLFNIADEALRGKCNRETILFFANISIVLAQIGFVTAWLGEYHRPQPQGKALTALPVELQTDEAIKRFARAEQEGVIERTQTGYRKKGITKAQLAYFLRKTYQAEAKSGAQFPETELNRLFAESRLGKAVSQLADNNGGGKPRGYQIIDALFVD